MMNGRQEIAQKFSILVLEEEPSMQMILTAAFDLQTIDLRFTSQHDLDIEPDFLPELILFDHSLTIIKEQENFCEKIRLRFPAIPLIVLSAYPCQQFAHYPYCMDLFIAKPFDLTHFLNCIARYVAQGKNQSLAFV